MAPQSTDERRNIIEAVKTPLGVFSLALLVVETLFGSLVLATSGTDRTFLLYAVVGILFLIIFLVAGIAVLRPEALWGKRYFSVETIFAESLAEDIHRVLDASLSNLEARVDQQQAWVALTEIIGRRRPGFPTAYSRFREALADGIQRRAGETEELRNTFGVVSA